MDKLALKDASLGVLHAMERASNRFLVCMGDVDVSFDIVDWSVGSLCREHSSECPDARTVSQLSSDMRQLECLGRLLNALTSSVSELLAFNHRKMESITTKLSKGLNSLPDEILAIIFHFATLDEQKGKQRAVWLSHVSKRFRQVSVEKHSLWSTVYISPNTSIDCVKMCLSRSGKDTDFRIILKYETKLGDCDSQFAAACSLSSSRCGSLSLINSDGFQARRNAIGWRLCNLVEEQQLVLPRLRDLSLVQCRWPIGPDSETPWRVSHEHDFVGIPPWEAPNLHNLRCIQYIPPLSFPFTTFTTISLSLRLTSEIIHSQVTALLNFLSQQHSVVTVKLELDTLKDECILHDVVNNPRVYPTVKSLSMKIMDFDTLSYETRMSRPFWNAMRMPNLENLSLVVDSASGWDPAVAATENSICLVDLALLLLDSDEHPKLSSLAVEMPAPSGGEECNCTSNSPVLAIPLEKIPHVSTVTVTTFAQVSFTRPKAYDNPQVYTGPSCLREVRLRSCASLDSLGLQNIVQSLKDAEAWDSLERVVIKDCKSLTYELALEAIGKEKLRFEN